ncbi:hypothetical protein BH11PSE1_BH11PSE1_16650 [soil metagenome]
MGHTLIGLFALLQAASPPITGMPLPEAPQWLERPTREDFENAVKGDVYLVCQITSEGRLSPCEVTDETPAGMGLAGSAISISGKFKMSTTLSTGETVGGHFRVMRMHFRLPPPPLPEGVRLIEKPQWLKRPSASDIGNLYPARAQRMDVAGSATMQCSVSSDGGLNPCTVIDEDPGEYGFGDAALQIGALLRLAPLDEDGQPVAGGIVRIPINFTLPGLW